MAPLDLGQSAYRVLSAYCTGREGRTMQTYDDLVTLASA
jgi:hypothetical protein